MGLLDATDHPMLIGAAYEVGWTRRGLAVWRLTGRSREELGAHPCGREVRFIAEGLQQPGGSSLPGQVIDVQAEVRAGAKSVTLYPVQRSWVASPQAVRPHRLPVKATRRGTPAPDSALARSGEGVLREA